MAQSIQEWAKQNLLKQTISLHTFYRLSSTNFTWSVLEYFVSYECCSLLRENLQWNKFFCNSRSYYRALNNTSKKKRTAYFVEVTDRSTRSVKKAVF